MAGTAVVTVAVSGVVDYRQNSISTNLNFKSDNGSNLTCRAASSQ